MVKIDEIMIGDWILWKSDKPENAFPVQVTVEMFKHELSLWPELFDYLELTDEIYKANNLTNPDGRFMIFDTDNWYFRIGEWLEENALNKKFTKIKIPEKNRPKYVHELQHTLKLYNIKYELNLE
jgi:hypothetical protein